VPFHLCSSIGPEGSGAWHPQHRVSTGSTEGDSTGKGGDQQRCHGAAQSRGSETDRVDPAEACTGERSGGEGGCREVKGGGLTHLIFPLQLRP